MENFGRVSHKPTGNIITIANRKSLIDERLNRGSLHRPFNRINLGGDVIEVDWIRLLAPAIVEYFVQTTSSVRSKSYHANYTLSIDSLSMKLEGLLRNFCEQLNLATNVTSKGGIQIYDLTIRANSIFNIIELADVDAAVRKLKEEAKKILYPLSEEEITQLEDEFREVEEFALKKYKYRQVQRALNYTFIYSIFENKFEIIDFAFQFHNPSDNTASWANDDIIIDSLFEILKFADNTWETESNLMFDWPDHHGTGLYIGIYIVALLNRWVLYHPPNDTASGGVDAFLRSTKKNDDQIKLWLRNLSEYTAIALRRRSLKLWPFENANDDLFNRFLQALERINGSFESHLEN